MKEIRILGVHVSNRMREGVEMKQIFGEYGCYIKTRLGLHEVQDEFCSESGIIVLELYGDLAKLDEFEAKLKALNGLEVQKMIFKL